MAEILVSDFCECRPPLIVGGHFHVFRLFRLFCALFFSLFPIVSAPAVFLKLAQGLAL
jgi:hypothetical protein